MTPLDATGVSRRQLLAVFGVALATYALSLTNGFVWDDVLLLVSPSSLQQLANFPEFFRGGVTAGTSFGQTVPYYRPLFSLCLALQYALWGANPLGYHLVNLLLHGLAALLVTLLAADLVKDRRGAVVAGLLFAVHPVHAEAVAYVAAVNELLCTIFALAALRSYIRSRDDRPWTAGLPAAAFFFAALLSKEMAITVPLLALAWDLICRGNSPGRALRRSLPLFGVCGIYLLLRATVLPAAALESPPVGVRLATSVTLVGEYLRLLVFPWPLRVLYDLPIRWSFGEPAVIAWGAVLAGAVALLVAYRRRFPLAVFAATWTLVSLLPASGLPGFIQPALIAERYLYLPSVGVALLAGVAVARFYPAGEARGRLVFAPAAIAALLLGGGLLAAWHGRAWHDEERFYKRMTTDAPLHPLGYYSLGNLYGRERRFGEMTALYQRSLDLNLRQQELAVRGYLARGDRALAEQEYRIWKTAAEWRQTLTGLGGPGPGPGGASNEPAGETK